MVAESKIHNTNLRETESGFTLIEFFQYIWKNLILVLGIIITTVVVGVMYTWFIATPKYTSSAELMFKIGEPRIPSISKYTRMNEIRFELPTVMASLKSPLFLNEVIDNAILDGEDKYLKYETEAEKQRLVNRLQGMLTVTNPKDQLLLKFSTTSINPKEAYVITKYVSETAKDWVNFSQYADDETLLLGVSNLIISPAKEPTSPSSPNKMLNIIISFMVGAILAVVAVLLKEQFSSNFKTTEQIEKLTGYPIIGEIFEQPKIGKED